MMSFIGSIVAWLTAGVFAYVLAVFLGQSLELHMLASLGTEISISVRLQSIWQSILGVYLYLLVILIAYGIGFYVASLVKAALPGLARIAYPVAGLSSVLIALLMMRQIFDIFPVPGGSYDLGVALHLFAAALGGAWFEFFRPKPKRR